MEAAWTFGAMRPSRHLIDEDTYLAAGGRDMEPEPFRVRVWAEKGHGLIVVARCEDVMSCTVNQFVRLVNLVWRGVGFHAEGIERFYVVDANDNVRDIRPVWVGQPQRRSADFVAIVRSNVTRIALDLGVKSAEV